MRRFAVGFSLAVMLAAGSGVQAKQVSIDFTGDTPVSQGLKQVNDRASADGVTTIVKRGGKNVAATGGTDAARYLYLAIDPAFKQGLKSVWVTVDYFDEGKGGFKLQYDGPDGAETTAYDPSELLKFDSQAFQRQVWHLEEPNLQGGMADGADLRIDDRGADDPDGPEFIAKVTVSDEDPYFTHFPYAVNKITIDGKKDDPEWAGAVQVTLDRPQQDAVVGSPLWKGPEDFSAVYSLKWDETALYILAEVKDSTPRLNDIPGGLKYWSGDGIELELGFDDSDPERTSYLDTDYKLEVGVGAQPGWALRINAGNDKITLDPIGGNIAITDVPGGYVYELQVPWSKIESHTVQPGQRIAWNIVANNSTVSPSDQQMSLSPTAVTDPWGHPNRWIRAVLDPRP
jgi:cellulose/xylan binding protein with CBM9 domain